MIGKSVLARLGGSTANRIGANTAKGLGLATVAGMGFAKGIRQSGAEDAFYEMATGNPNIDEDILGTDISPMNLLLNLPLSRTNTALNGAPFARSGIPRLMATIPTGFVNRKMVGAAFSRAKDPFVPEGTTPNTMPRADGSIVFGMNNARHGG